MSVSGEVVIGQPPAGGGLRRRVLVASLWSVGSLTMSQVLRLGGNILLARMLLPDEFGRAALISALLTGLRMFSDVGLGPSVVRSVRGEEDLFLDTAFTMQAVRGVLLWVLSCVAAWPMAGLYGPEFLTLVPWAGLTAVLAGLSSSRTLLTARRLDQWGPAKLEIVTLVVNVAGTLVWARYDATARAIVGGWLASEAARTVLTHLWFGGWRDRLRFDRAAALELAHFGRWILVSTAVTFASQQADRMVLGVVVPLSVVGVFSMSSVLTRLPIEVISRLAANVLFPALANMGRDDLPRALAGLARARRVLTPAALAACVGVATCGPAMMLLAYPSAYGDAAWMTPALTLSVWFTLQQAAIDRVLLISGHTRALAVANILKASLAVGGGLGGYWIGMWAGGEAHEGWRVGGFIMGLAASALGGYAVVAAAVGRLGLPVWRGDAVATARFAGLVGLTWAGVRGWEAAAWPGGRAAGWAVCGGAVSAMTVLACARRIALELGFLRR